MICVISIYNGYIIRFMEDVVSELKSEIQYEIWDIEFNFFLVYKKMMENIEKDIGKLI